jgi:hypothetical protein
VTGIQLQPPPPPPLGPPHPVRAARAGRWFDTAALRGGAVVVVVLAATGALLGIVWQWWSPPGPAAFVLPGHAMQPDETEAFVAADGRYALLTAAVGLLAAGLVWRRRELRGPVAAAALAAGGVAGALLTEVVGRALDGGAASGAVGSVLPHLRIDVHTHALRLLEPLVAVLVYSLCVAFAAADDLGNPRSVEADGQPQHGRGDGDAAGALQQPQLAAEQWYGQP